MCLAQVSDWPLSNGCARVATKLILTRRGRWTNNTGGTTEGKGIAMEKGYWTVCMLLGILLFTACGNEAPKDQATSVSPSGQAGQSVRVVEVTLSFVQPRFRPDPIEIKVGETVQFKVSSADTQHHFVVEPLGIDIEVPPKSMHESVTTKVVTPTEAGTFRMFCSVHARMPMEGTLVVSEAKP